jgi:hypothetical protein
MDFKVTAKQHGNSVEFIVNATDIKVALAQAKREAGSIFDYKVGDEMPTVSVKPVKEKNED